MHRDGAVNEGMAVFGRSPAIMSKMRALNHPSQPRGWALMPNELVEARVLDRFGFAIEHEQARLVATSQRLLRNQFFGQVVV